MYETIIYDVREGVAVISLNRPDVINAINQQLGQELYAALKRAELEPGVRAVVLTGVGRGFCAGQDLGDDIGNDTNVDIGDLVRERYNVLITKMHTLSIPLIAAVNGAAAGAGFSLALACDVRFASTSAKFTMAFSKIGLAPDSGGSYFLPRLVGIGRALELAWTGDVISAGEALELGIVNKAFAPEELMEKTMEFAVRLAKGPTKAFALTKQAIFANAQVSLPEALEGEAQWQAVAGKTSDFLEGVQAFREKRLPNFSGK